MKDLVERLATMEVEQVMPTESDERQNKFQSLGTFDERNIVHRVEKAEKAWLTDIMLFFVGYTKMSSSSLVAKLSRIFPNTQHKDLMKIHKILNPKSEEKVKLKTTFQIVQKYTVKIVMFGRNL